MKIKNLILITALFFLSGTFKGQSNNNWIPVLISTDGTNGNAGVEASYMLAKCNASDVVFIKLTNNNQYPVTAQWIDLVQTKDGKEHFGNSKVVSIKLGAKSETTGDCTGNTAQLIITLSDFGVDVKNFETVVGSNFYVAK